MLDIQVLRTDLAGTAQRLAERNFTLDVAAFEALERERKTIQTETQDLQAKRNQLSKQVGQAKSKGEDASALMAQVSAQADELKSLEQKLVDVQAKLNEFLQVIPNLPHASVPAGKSADDNPEVRRVGTPRSFDFTAKDHVDIGAGLGMLDFDAASKVAGARFSVLKGPLARMHRALAQLMLDVHTTDHGYTEVYVPYMVTGECANGVSSLSKFKTTLQDRRPRSLSHPDRRVPGDQSGARGDPPRVAVPRSMSAIHRASAASRVIRQGHARHDPPAPVRQGRARADRASERSYERHEELTRNAEVILQKLELPYRTVTLCTGDIVFSSARPTTSKLAPVPERVPRDLLVQQLRSFSSAAHAGAVQKRKRQAEHVHTLNGSGWRSAAPWSRCWRTTSGRTARSTCPRRCSVHGRGQSHWRNSGLVPFQRPKASLGREALIESALLPNSPAARGESGHLQRRPDRPQPLRSYKLRPLPHGMRRNTRRGGRV